ncbi:MAG: SRPBCC family protein [Deltaproteobacteria bacterium]|nr:SRPBCC family protein [Deltaproteobacteria bacterium]
MKTHEIVSLLGAALASLSTVACGPSLATMHDRAATGQVQEGAPLHTRQSVTIAAPRAEVYAVLTDVAAWPRWQPNVSKVTPPEPFTPGARFTWTNGSSAITSQLAAVTPGELVAWTGSVSVAKAVHVWRFSSPTPDTTLVEVEETMDGFLLTWFYGQKDLEADVGRSLAQLKTTCEARPRATLAGSVPAP